MITSPEAERFSEREFYRLEFRGRTMGITVPTAAVARDAAFHDTLEELVMHGARVVLVAAEGVPAAFVPYEEIALPAARLEGAVWRALQRRPGVVVRADADLSAAARQTTTRLGLFKLVWLTELGGLREPGGRRRSFADLGELADLSNETWLEPAATRDLLREVEALLRAGVPCVNVCRVDGLGDELFTYSGSGTLFTRERYVSVRRFGIEDYDAAADLIARGTAEGYLAPRTEAQVDTLLAEGFGAFVGGEHLAGIGALRVAGNAGEVASLYTLTRFTGGGVGRHLVTFAVAEARRLGLDFVYACTTFDRVGKFFRAQGFAPATPDEIPADKWDGYDAARRATIRCFRREVDA